MSVRPENTHVALLKEILENLRFPERLDAHPWAESLVVEAAAADPAAGSKGRGAQLALAIGALFREGMPATPPNQEGKRLDTRWGRFGILAATYFAPLLYGRLYPNSLRDAWRRIDQAIYLFVYGVPGDDLKLEQLQAYEFIGKAPDLPANSTISDWHRDGVQELADRFVEREKSLSLSMGKASTVMDEAASAKTTARKRGGARAWRAVLYVVLATLLAVGLAAGVKGYRLYSLALPLTDDVKAVRALGNGALELGTAEEAGALLERTHAHLEAVRVEAAPLFGLARQLGWVPVYGGDLRQAEDLLGTATSATDAARRTYQAARPVLEAVQQEEDVEATELTRILINTRPQLMEAQAALDQAMSSRRRVDDAELSPTSREILQQVDPYLQALDGGLSIALALPGLLGASDSGPKTYLILVQNEDELRATGGFITAVGKAVVRDGALMDLSIRDSYDVDDIKKPYPAAPWQMQSFMNIPILVFRDVSWFSDYPTAVLWAEYLYAYTNAHSVDGIIAIDQHVLEKLLAVTGPVYVSEIGLNVTAENLKAVMRAQKVPPPPDQRDPEWHRKQFMNPISAAILQRLTSGKGLSWEQLLKAMLDELDERHILVQLDDPTLSALLAERGWDGAVRNPGGDFLMVVDTNVGYNKTNAVVSSRLVYDVDLTDTAAPRANLAVFHHNAADGDAGPCDQRPTVSDRTIVEAWYAIDRCYYDYLRIYVPAGTRLLAATPHAVTRQEMVMLDQDVPARVDVLNENIQDIDGFGTLLVVPMGQTLATSFTLGLPADILQPGSDAREETYELKIQKQPGIALLPVTLRVHLPANAVIRSVTPTGIIEGGNVLFELELRGDFAVRISFLP